MRGDPKRPLELFSGGWVPCSTGFLPLLGECSSWCCCERLPLVSVIFFKHSLSAFAYLMMGDFPAHLPIPWVFSSIWPKPSMIHMPHPPYSQDLTLSNFFFVSLDEKSPQREMFCQCGRGETKNGRSTKRHQNRRIQNLFWAVKSLDRCSESNGEYFEGDWSLNM